MAGKVAVWVGAASYGVGLVIVNTHLLKYGVSQPTLLRADYVLAGLLWIVLTGIAGISVLGFLSTWRYVRRDWRARHRVLAVIKAVLSPVLLPAALLFPVIFLSAVRLQFDQLSFWIVVGILLLTGGLLIGAARTVVQEVRKWRSQNKPFEEFPVYEIVFQCFMALAALSAYSQWVYPELLPTYGGGRATSVRLVPAQGSTDIFRGAFGSATDQDTIFELIGETDNWLIVTQRRRIPGTDEAAVRVRRDLVAAIRAVPGK